MMFFTFAVMLFGTRMAIPASLLPPEPAIVAPTATVVPTPQPTPTPTPQQPSNFGLYSNLYSPAYDADYDWGCQDIIHEGESCIQPDWPIVDQITTALYLEGGVAPVLLVNHLQLLENEMKSILQTNEELNPLGIELDDLARPDRERLALYLLSRGYETGVGTTHSAWNGWEMPYPYGIIEKMPDLVNLIDRTGDMVNRWLDGNGIKLVYYGRQYQPFLLLQNDPRILYTYSSIGHYDEYLDVHRSMRLVLDVGGVTYYVYYLTFPYYEGKFK